MDNAHEMQMQFLEREIRYFTECAVELKAEHDLIVAKIERTEQQRDKFQAQWEAMLNG